MPTLAAIKDVYSRHGVRGVVRRGARWVRRRLPGAKPAAARPAPAPATSPPSPVTVDLATALAWFEARRPTYEGLVDAVAGHLPRHGTVLDIGANIGFFTRVLTERAGFRGTAHLFEPVPNLADLCEQSVRTLPCSATVHRVALGAETGSARIFVARDGNLGWNTLVGAKVQPERMLAVDVDVVRYDDLGIAAVPDLVKIDVEGAEYLVLAGLLPALRAWTTRPVILCEIGWGTGHPSWTEELAAFEALSALGYEPRGLDGEPVDLRSVTRTTDVLFVPHAPA